MPDGSPPPRADTGLAELNDLPREQLVEQLLTCLDVARWADELADQRPFGSGDALLAAADEAAGELSDAELGSALAAHPRIGERANGTESGAQFSQREQSGVDDSDADLTTALRRGNEEYERRFGHVYLVCASGRSGQELLDILRSRLENDAATERRVVIDELRKIARLRLARLIEQ